MGYLNPLMANGQSAMNAHPHLCLVSNQPVPSLTPLLDPGLNGGQVLLLAAPDRQQHARWLQQALASQGIAAQLQALQSGYDLPALRADFAKLAARYPTGVTANITGGSKLMTIAAWEAFDRPGDRLYYVDIREDQITWLRPAGRPVQAIADRVRLDTYFAALGQGFRNGVLPLRQALRGDTFDQLRQRARRLAQHAQPSKGDSQGGYWLEELVFEEIRRLAETDKKIHDVARQFVLSNGGDHDTRLENEIDVAVLRDNTLYLAECKTGSAGVGPAAMKALFKLAQLRESLGGLRGRGLFVSSERVSSVVHERGRQLGIRVIDRPGLQNLSAELRQALHTPW